MTDEPYQVCTVCTRRTAALSQFDAPCIARDEDNRKCRGRMVPPRAEPVEDQVDHDRAPSPRPWSVNTLGLPDGFAAIYDAEGTPVITDNCGMMHVVDAQLVVAAVNLEAQRDEHG